MLSCSLSLCSGQSSFLTPPGPSISTGMGSHWLLLLLLLLSRDRAFNLPSRASVWVLASDSSSTSGPLLNGKLSCPSTSSSLPHNMKGQNSEEEPNSPSVTKTSTSKSQDQMTSSTLPAAPQSRSITGPTEETTPTVHTPVMTITNDMSLSDSTVTSTGKELIGTPQTTVLFSLATSAETPQLSQTPPSSTLDTVSDTNKPLSMTTMTVTITSSPSTATTPETTVLDTATTEIQEKDTASVPPSPATTPTTSKPPDTHHSTVTQTPSQPAQTASDVSMTPETTTSPPKSTNNTGMGSSVSPSPGDTDRTLTTPSMALSTPEDAISSSGTGTPSVPEKSALTPSSSTLDTVSDTNKPLSMTTMTVTTTSSPTTATTPGTTVLDTATTEVQGKDTATVPPSPETTSTTSKPPDTHHSTVTLTPSQPAQTASDVSMTPETTTSPPKSTNNTGMGSSVSPSPGDTDRTLTTPSMALSTPEDAISSSGTGTPSVPEKSALTPSSSTLDTVSDTNKPLSMTTMTVTTTSSPTTATTPGTTVLDTATTEVQGKDTATVPPSPETTSTTSKPPDTHHSTVTLTPSQPAQTASDVSMTPETTTSPPKSTNTGMGSSVSPSPGDTDRTLTTPSMALSTPEDAISSSGTGTPSVPEKSALTPSSSTLDTVSDTNKPLSMTTMTVTTTSSPSTATTLGTTVLDTATTEIQEKDTASVPPSPATTPTTTAVILRSSETTKSSTMTGTNPAPPNSSQSSGVDGGACALDEYLDSTRGCMCNGSYYSHLELSRDIGTLRCRPQDIEVALRSCFLKTHHWVLKDDAFSRCFSINTIEEGRRVQVFQLEKKEGTCGLHISTNVSHALHSLDVHLQQALPGSPSTGFRELHFSCAYPLVVNVSKPVSYQEASIPTIHIPSTGETVITLSIFTDSHLSSPLKNSTAPVGMPLYVVLKSTNSDPGRFALVANEVFASTDLSNTVTKTTYHFVKGSCPVQGRLLQDLSNGASTQVTLAFTLSRFLNSDTLYLHAQVTLCDKQASRPCQPSCSGKNPRRRNSPWASPSKSRLEHGDSKWIIFGPLRISAPRASSTRSGAGAWMSILLLMVIGWMLD